MGLLQARAPERARKTHENSALHNMYAHLRIHSLGGLNGPLGYSTLAAAFDEPSDLDSYSCASDMRLFVRCVAESRRAVDALAIKPQHSSAKYHSLLRCSIRLLRRRNISLLGVERSGCGDTTENQLLFSSYRFSSTIDACHNARSILLQYS